MDNINDVDYTGYCAKYNITNAMKSFAYKNNIPLEDVNYTIEEDILYIYSKILYKDEINE